MMSAHRLSDVRHSQLLGSLSFLPARREALAAVIPTMSLGAPGFRRIVSGCGDAALEQF